MRDVSYLKYILRQKASVLGSKISKKLKKINHVLTFQVQSVTSFLWEMSATLNNFKKRAFSSLSFCDSLKLYPLPWFSFYFFIALHVRSSPKNKNEKKKKQERQGLINKNTQRKIKTNWLKQQQKSAWVSFPPTHNPSRKSLFRINEECLNKNNIP